MKIQWGWAAATVVIVLATVLLLASGGGSCASQIEGAGSFVDACQSGPTGGYPAKIVLALAGMGLAAVCGRRALRRT